MNDNISQASYLFDKYSADGAVALLKSLPNLPEKTFESDWLDFKTGKPQDEDVKYIWSKAIGAFANNEGGVLVWGLVCKKDTKTMVDAVTSVALVPDVFALMTRLMELRHGATDPPVADIQIKALPISTASPEGFVVCYIPESTSRPHRCEYAEKRFYIRMGDSARESSVSLLRQLFYPKRNPRMQVELKRIERPRDLNLQMIGAPTSADPVRAIVEVGVRNIGEISIDDVAIHLDSKDYTLIAYHYDTITARYDANVLEPVLHLARVIHPGIRTSIPLAVCSFIPEVTSDCNIVLYARDMMPRRATLPFGAKVGDFFATECLP